ncbi:MULTISPECIES: dihydrofolate reductase family protein [unclassified Leifsonia]|uniref:dihydrofolate reductase family protein n=1 Tax=unclassified Leifsonia TaxID=2663824 RepID=UPI0006F250A9|nr:MULTISPECIES: dihydrofolate reductase family protein [unclassified Leifsonia]KQX07061.1 deaminase [Leifsonia sp. Root1293]KRA11344.1 deaminase [Leifsonia sp. Root60]
MARLIWSGIQSLDGYIADSSGGFDWAAPDDEVHSFVNDRERGIGTYLYGRRLYEVMKVWQDIDEAFPDVSPSMLEYARLWREADKVVYSTTLASTASPRTRLEGRFDPDDVRRLLAEADADVSIGGAELASQAVRAGLVDVYQLYVNPVIVGGGTSYLPPETRIDLDLTDEHRFSNGVVFLEYRPRR